MPKFIAIHKNRLDVSNKRVGINRVLKKAEGEGVSEGETLHFRNETNPLANQNPSVTNALQENTTRNMAKLRTKKAQAIANPAQGAPATGQGAGLVLSDISIRPRYLNEKKKGNIKFSID